MKLLRGLAEAKSWIDANRSLDADNLPPQVLAKTQELFGRPLTPAQAVEEVIQQVRKGGDAALRDLTRRLDGVDLGEIEVPPSAIADAYDQVPRELAEALELAARRVGQFHEESRVRSWVNFNEGYGQLITAVHRVGIYVPGGTALYPSTVLMTAIPARVAGVREVILCTPPRRSGRPHPALLVAADIAAVNTIFCVGGAQAIAAMACGTESIPRVDMVCGPGNIFVTLAKKLLFGEVGIDGLYGPTETVIVADQSASPKLCAADLLAQAEHDILATPILVTPSKSLAEAVAGELRRHLEGLERSQVAGEAMAQRGCIAVVEDLVEALDLANHVAPEHLCIMTKEPWACLGQVRNAGAIFLGESSNEALGDYVAGPSHVMPTGGTARFASGLGVHSFVKVSPILALDRETAGQLAKAAALIARAEGLTAHAQASEARQEQS